VPQQAEWVEAWCRHCGAMHEQHGGCPGQLLATGPERHGWRVLVETPSGPIVYGTLVAPAGDVWRARILTYPNVLWVLPRGSTIKFVGATPGAAEQGAIDFIKQHCRRRNYGVRKEVPTVESGDVDLEQDESAAKSDAVRTSERRKRAVHVRYGITRLTETAVTDDLSEGGLFIRTEEPMPIGTSLQLRLEVDGYGFPLRGLVRWTQDEEEVGRPTGMGIKLINPHPRYIHYLRQQKKAASTTQPPTTSALEEWDDPEI
jgi:Tfp pilus assembly protein PilZ